MAELALLNETHEAATCRDMIALVERRLRAFEKELCTMVLDREAYLQKIGAADALRKQQDELQSLFRKRFPS